MQPMGPLDLINHLLNFFFPALGLGALAAAGAKLIWRRELASTKWAHLARDCSLAGAAMLVLGLWLWGRDGRMVTYGAMVLATAVVLWWRAFGLWPKS